MREERLHVWIDGDHVGEFMRTSGGHVSFHYDSKEGAPISLSLPRTGKSSGKAASAFLENLLPDDENARRRMALRLHLDSTDTFKLLADADTVGGLVFSDKPELPHHPIEAKPLDEEEIGNQIGYVRANGYNWFARDDEDEFYERDTPKCRFSIAGGQPKFTLARRAGVWLWPNASIPSTHIIKPEMRDCPGSHRVEDATLTLGTLCGLPVSEHGVLTANGAEAFITRRFDRIVDGNNVRRIHCEDLAQAMGMDPESKYEIGAASCVRFLHHFDPSDETGYEWVRRLAFNVSSGDSDSHGKNYSIVLAENGFRFAPMYDMTVTRIWPHVDQEMAMPINGVEFAELLTPSDWETFAEKAGLDGERVAHIARTMAGAVLDHLDEASAGLPDSLRESMRKAVSKANENIQPLHDRMPLPKTNTASFGNGGVWVSPHIRSGYPVSGYWRSR